MKYSKMIIYRLELSEEERLWLKAYLQNPQTEDESEKDEKMRKTFFMALEI